MDQAERDAYHRITKTWAELDAWRARLSSVEPPPPGSELADDDTDHEG